MKTTTTKRKAIADAVELLKEESPNAPDTSAYAKQLAEKTAEESDPLKELLYEMVSMLPEDDQELYRLYYTEGYSQEEIAEKKGVSQNTISKKLRRVKKQLTEMCRKAV